MRMLLTWCLVLIGATFVSSTIKKNLAINHRQTSLKDNEAEESNPNHFHRSGAQLVKRSAGPIGKQYSQRPIDVFGSSFVKRTPASTGPSRISDAPDSATDDPDAIEDFIFDDEETPVDVLDNTFIQSDEVFPSDKSPIESFGDNDSYEYGMPMDQGGSSFIKKRSSEDSSFLRRPLDDIGSRFIKRNARSLHYDFNNKPVKSVGNILIKRDHSMVQKHFLRRPLDTIGSSFIRKRKPSVSQSFPKRPIDSIGSGLIKKGIDYRNRVYIRRPIDTIGNRFIKRDTDSISRLSEEQPIETNRGVVDKRSADPIGSSETSQRSNVLTAKQNKIMYSQDGKFKKQSDTFIWKSHVNKQIDPISSNFVKRDAEILQGNGFD